jgi:hypothetical protein
MTSILSTQTIGGVTFSVSVNPANDNSIQEVCITIDNIGDDNMLVVAFNRGGLTLCGDSIHLAVDGDEAYCE